MKLKYVILLKNKIIKKLIIYFLILKYFERKAENGDWGLGIGDLGFGVWGKAQTPNPQHKNPKKKKKIYK